MKLSRFFLLITFLFTFVGRVPLAQADFVFSPFGLNGEGGQAKGQIITFGIDGSIFDLDSFISIDGEDLNDSDPGMSRPLSFGPPDDIGYSFSHRFMSNQSNLLLIYSLINESDRPLNGLQFLVFVDAEVDATTSYSDEFGEVAGAVGKGALDPDPDSWEIDEPGFAFGNIFANLQDGILDNTNAIPSTSPEDVSLALGFQLGALNPGDTATIEILLSDNGTSIGSFALRHADPTSSDTLTISGQATVAPAAAIPEPTSMIPLGTGLLALACYTGYRRRS